MAARFDGKRAFDPDMWAHPTSPSLGATRSAAQSGARRPAGQSRQTRFILIGILFLVCVMALCSSLLQSMRRQRNRQGQCNDWSQVAEAIRDDDLESLQRLMEHTRYRNDDMSSVIENILKVMSEDDHHSAGVNNASRMAQAEEDGVKSGPPLNRTVNETDSNPGALADVIQDSNNLEPGDFEELAGVIESTELPASISPYFNSTMMDTPFWKECRAKRDDVDDRWDKELLWKAYKTFDISPCGIRAPECGMWLLPQVNKTKSQVPNIYRKCCVEHMKLRTSLEHLLSQLDSSNISYWLGMGTLLGQFRHNGTMIAWDSDADLYISEDDEDKLVKALANSRDLGHYVEKDHSAKKRPMYWYFADPEKPSIFGGTHVEIWLWKWKKPQNKNIIFPLQRCKLYDTQALCPKDVEALLNKHYAQDSWRNKYSVFIGGKFTLNLSIM